MDLQTQIGAGQSGLTQHSGALRARDLPPPDGPEDEGGEGLTRSAPAPIMRSASRGGDAVVPRGSVRRRGADQGHHFERAGSRGAGDTASPRSWLIVVFVATTPAKPESLSARRRRRCPFVLYIGRDLDEEATRSGAPARSCRGPETGRRWPTDCRSRRPGGSVRRWTTTKSTQWASVFAQYS